MSMAIGHFAFGTSCTMVVFHMLPLRIRIKMRIAQIFIVTLGGMWAMLPDVALLSNLLRRLKVPGHTIFISYAHAFHASRWANICFFHQFMDSIDKNDSVLVAGALVFIMAATVSVIFIRELQERGGTGERLE